MSQPMTFRLSIAVAIAIGASVIACGSSPESGGGDVPQIASGAMTAQDMSCVKTRSSTPDPSTISATLASTCGCSQDPVHIDGCAERWNFVDCSNATSACVNGVLDANGWRNAPISANTISIGSCAPFAVVYDPCVICRQNGPGSGGGGATLGDYCPRYAH